MEKFKYFKMTEIFEVTRGSRLIKLNQIAGEIPYISSTKFNNGVDNYISPPETMVVFNNCLTISNSGSVGYTFYHDYDFVASDHVTVLKLKKIHLNKFIAMYLVPILNGLRDNYHFNREMSNKRLKKEYIMLPIDGNGKVDWAYMEEYIKGLVKKIEWKEQNIATTANNISVDNWESFKLSDLFVFKKGKRITKEKLMHGDVPFISAISKNNGIREFVELEPLHKGNCITVNYNGSVGEAFYQISPFWASDDVNVLYLKNKELTSYIAIFLITLIKKNKVNFDFGRKWNTEKMKNTEISLPVKNGKPDWEYMDNFIKSLNYSAFIE